MSDLLTMWDSVDLAQIPADAQFLACYVDGWYANAAEAARRFPHARILTIAVSAAHDADCLDIEQGDATPADAAAWFLRQEARGITRPCLYASADLMQTAVLPALHAAGISRDAVRLWSAHYTGSPHRCGPSSCGLLSGDADGTQWTDAALGRNLDQSLLLPDFFGAAPAPIPPTVPPWQEAMMQALPVLRQGATGPDVRTIQSLAIARGHATAVDGVFGNATRIAIEACQRSAGVTVDGIVGLVTWGVLVTGSAP